jgi:tellurite resistance protein TerC
MPEGRLQVPWEAWVVFVAFIVALLSLDLLVFNRRPRKTSVRGALGLAAFWVCLALCFAWGVYAAAGPVPASQFLSGYLLELSLSVDNLFVFILIFAAYQVPAQHLRKALFWGVLGAVVLRLAFIGLGAALINRYEWMLVVFGAFLLFTGVKLLFQRGASDVGRGWIAKRLQRHLPLSEGFDERGAFFVRRKGRWLATPLLLVVLIIESTDILFAVDSIPAVFGVTRDPFIVYSSNIFAILGLRSLFFALEGLMQLFRFLKVALALVLVLIGLKLCFARVIEQDWGLQHLEPWVLGTVAALLLGSVGLSVLIPEKKAVHGA